MYDSPPPDETDILALLGLIAVAVSIPIGIVYFIIYLFKNF